MESEQVDVIRRYSYQEYEFKVVKQKGYINYGSTANYITFDLLPLINRWGIDKEQLNYLVSLDILFKQALRCYYTESNEGHKVTTIIQADVVINLLKKLRDTEMKCKVDIGNEIVLISRLIEVVKEDSKNAKPKS